MTTTTRYDEPRVCWSCRAANDADSGHKRPKTGDVGICFTCGALAIFTDDHGHQRQPTPAEHEGLIAIPAIADVVGRVLALRAVG